MYQMLLVEIGTQKPTVREEEQKRSTADFDNAINAAQKAEEGIKQKRKSRRRNCKKKSEMQRYTLSSF